MEALMKNDHHSMDGVSLILAPLLLAISSFLWIDSEYGVTGGTVLVLSIVFWMPALICLFGIVKDKMPCVGFINFHLWIYDWFEFRLCWHHVRNFQYLTSIIH